ncbi:MAG TPA: hypothetical protein VG148_05105 [Pyrinomonadaceae bacterium]|nr:hypothetical protein [Pyrinomonadaceae bacterium]
MLRKTFFALVFIASCFGPAATGARAQTDEPKFEAGVHFSALHFEERGVCLREPCPTFVVTSSGQTEPGGGVRFGYNVSRNVAVEAELNLFPRDRELEGGRKVQGLFGVKAGKRYETVGLFAKARPGFLHSSRGDFTPRRGFVCPAIFPAPIGCYDPKSRTDFALDVGGVVELYASRRVLVRFDVGDTLVFHGDGLVPVFVPPAGGTGAPRVGVAPAPSETTHNLQGSVGIGFRF